MTATVAAGIVLVVLHWLIALLASRSDLLDRLVKSPCYDLIRDGQRHKESMRKADVSPRDPDEALRLRGSVTRVEDVESACLERNGDISVISRRPSAKLLEINVEKGVQRIRTELV